MDADADGDEEEEAFAINGRNTGDGAKAEGKETETSRVEEKQYFQCHDNRNKQHGMEKVIGKTSDQMVVPIGMMGQDKNRPS